MPKVNQTMLDKLVDVFQSGSQRKPEIIQATTIRDPLGYSMVQRRFGAATGKLPSTAPERQMYQRGLNNRDIKALRPLYEKHDEYEGELEDLQNEFEEAFDEAKEGLVEDIRSDMDYFEAPEIQYGFDTGLRGDLSPDIPKRSLEDYWPERFKTPGWYNDKGYELGDLIDEYQGRIDYINTPEHRMELQRQTPRYRRYQEAMQRRDINRRAGRVNAAIMNLARQGYSLSEIREILRRQGR